MKYISTRNGKTEISGAEAILNGIAEDGGLYVPSSFPKLTAEEIGKLAKRRYPERAAYIMAKFLDEFSYEELLEYCDNAYSRFEGGDPCPVMQIEKGLYILELWHGPTHAFKDMALTVMPYLMTGARKKLNAEKKTMILVATSGDTGKAALEGFKDVEGTGVAVFYPAEGVSRMQRLQMSTQKGENVYVGAVKGNFDDAQTAVKAVFADADVKKKLADKGWVLSSANSINWGRLLPQIAYYVSAYCDILDGGEISLGDKVNFTVPSGNFGNILAGYYAYRMGLPVSKLICASNVNNVLTDFFVSGNYDSRREFFKTISPSMDILVSSNLERLIFEFLGRDGEAVKSLMTELKETGSYKLEKSVMYKQAGLFSAGFTTEEETYVAMANFYDEYDYLLDPHTAVAMSVYSDFITETSDPNPTVIVSTASPYKFPQEVYQAVEEKTIDDPFKACKKLYNLSALPIPKDLLELEKAEARFKEIYEVKDIKKAITEDIKWM